MGGHFSGGDPQMQQQAQSQAQISSLQQQNALLNQQLATQAASPHPPTSTIHTSFFIIRTSTTDGSTGSEDYQPTSIKP
jgi:hypothetical protein